MKQQELEAKYSYELGPVYSQSGVLTQEQLEEGVARQQGYGEIAFDDMKTARDIRLEEIEMERKVAEQTYAGTGTIDEEEANFDEFEAVEEETNVFGEVI